MGDKEIDLKEKSVAESIEDQFDDLFTPKKPVADTDAVKKDIASDGPPVKKVQPKPSTRKPLDKKETVNKVTYKTEQPSPNRPSVKSAQLKRTPNKTLIKKITSPAKTERSKPVVKDAYPPDMKEMPSEDSSKPPVQNVFKKANQKYKKNNILDKAKQGLYPLLFTLLILLLVLLSMFIGKILIPDEMMEFFNIKKSSTLISKPVSIEHTNKKKVIVSREKKVSSPKTEIKKLELEKPDIQNKVAFEEEKRAQVETDIDVSVKVEDESHKVIKEEIKSFPYSIYLGSYGSIDKVKTAAADFIKMGITAYWIKLDLGEKGTWFRLFTGYFQTREEADAFIKTEKLKDAESRLTKYTNLIGIYKLMEDADRQKKHLEELGYSPYIISGTRNIYRLYTGAFSQEGRAEELKNALKLNSIKSDIVER